ncbi:cbb3-type cytochrome oxidase assembly protein CcoS [Photobacterium andalusiense]|uniref:Cytochrome oxidase maturation protein cbb3-type n=1 Tax=Photobacterium andalusiense TaxID=2204296 RepID=A0A1Y6M912_9GAMM|nr:cbb3-type cytochrome oxidase assembly protein CcoS [Photobacterium andalusiense]SMY33067.1 Cytochrome oxidase maturation protein cbb3-type [Photobacterium andalusiense]
MAILYILIPIALFFIGLAIAVFLWAVKTNQFDDLERRGHDILFDDDLDVPKKVSQRPHTNPLKSANVDHDRT